MRNYPKREVLEDIVTACGVSMLAIALLVLVLNYFGVIVQ